MTENFLFKAVFISLAAHTAILWVACMNRMNSPHEGALRLHQIEVSYQSYHKKIVQGHPVRMTRRLDLSNNQKFFSNGTIPVNLVKERSMKPLGMFYESPSEHRRTMELSRRVSIMPIISEKINNPVYAAYNEMVRDRIKEKVYDNYDKIQGGIVYLTFLLDDNGVLKASRIIPEKTNASQHLQELSLRSLREASPFPRFLKGMNLSEYPFNIEIQYEVSDN